MKILLFSIVSFSFITVLYVLGMFERLENFSLDIRIKYIHGKDYPADNISVILIDEPTINMMNNIVGRWPWPREVFSEVIDYLSLGQPKAIVFDILFTEKSNFESDKELAISTKKAGNVIHSMLLYTDKDKDNITLLPEDFIKLHSLKNASMDKKSNKSYNNFSIPYPELYKSAKSVGVVEFPPEKDGIYRSTYLIGLYDKYFFPSLGLATYLETNCGNYYIFQTENSLNIKCSKIYIEVPQKNGKYYLKPYEKFETFSMSGIIYSIISLKHGDIKNIIVSPYEFKDKVIFIGASAVGLEDIKPTSLSPTTPGVFLQASIYSNFVKKEFYRFVNTYIVIIIGFLLSYIMNYVMFTKMHIIEKLLISMVIPIVYVGINLLLFKFLLVIDFIYPLTLIIFSLFVSLIYTTFKDEKEKRKIKKTFERYVSKAVIKNILENPENSVTAIKGIKAEISILFSDIRGFTTISESLPPEQVVNILNIYFDKMVEIIFKNEGTVDKFIGDAIMAFWGAPIKIYNHADKAIETAIEMVDALNSSVNPSLREKGLPEINMGIGINTGQVILGNIGSKERSDYTVIGDNVNLASRLEGLTKYYGVNIIASDFTVKRLTTNKAIPRILDLVTVKGKSKAVKIYQIIEKNQHNIQISTLSEMGFNYYVSGKWEFAIETYQKILSIKPDDRVSNIFIERCKKLLENPPENWDGVWQFKEK